MVFKHGSVATNDAWMYLFLSITWEERKKIEVRVKCLSLKENIRKNVEQLGRFSKVYYDIYATFCSSILSANVHILMMTQCETQRQFLEL